MFVPEVADAGARLGASLPPALALPRGRMAKATMKAGLERAVKEARETGPTSLL